MCQEGTAVHESTAVVAQLTTLEKAALLSGKNTWQTRAIPRVGLRSLWMADGPHGVRRQLGSADHLGIHSSEPATCFPPAATVANSWDEQLATEIGSALGREAKSQQVDVLLGPGLNIKRSPLGGRNFEYFSEDPEVSGRLAAAYVRGIQAQGVAATPKHFAVNSQEQYRMASDSVLDERTLRELYLTAFEIVVREASPWAIMSAYNLVGGVYAHEHEHLLTRILRDEWGFDGAVISDWGGSNDPVAAVAAGGTLEMPSPGFDSARRLVSAVEDGELDPAHLDARAREVVDLVARVTAPSDGSAHVDPDAHHLLARRAAAESAVLLRNVGNVLPLASGSRVALVGVFADEPRFQGAGSSTVNPTRVANLRDAIGEGPLELHGYAAGFRRDGRADDALREEAVALAASADVVVLSLGLPEIAESEGRDRADLSLPDVQVELLEAVAQTNSRTVVLLSAGGPVELPWFAQASALVHGYLGGQAGAEAMVDVLTGAVEPGGRLAETLPVQLSDTPTFGRFPSADPTAEYREGLYVGYRYYDAAGVRVAYPFGFGLGYTSFEYSNLRVDPASVTVTVANVGARAGSDVVQLYVGRVDPSCVYRPVRELKGFAKVRLDAGQRTTVTLALDDRAFRFFDVETGCWQAEPGLYEICVGRHSRDLPLRATIAVPGTIDPRVTEADARDPYRTAAVRQIDDASFAALLGRPIPPSSWPDPPLGLNDPMSRLREAPGALARLVFGVLDRKRRAAEASGHPDLNILFLFNGPFRVISKMSGGRATVEFAEAALLAVNGQPLRGFRRMLAAFVRGRRDERATGRAFDAVSGSRTSGGRR